MGLSIALDSLFWLFLPHLTPSTTRSYSNACSFLLAYLVTSSPGWLHSSMLAPSAWSMGHLGPNGSPPLMAFPRARCWPLFSIWDVMAHWLRRLLSTRGSWVRLPLWPSRRDLGQVLYLQLPVRFGVKLRYSIRAVVGSASEW